MPDQSSAAQEHALIQEITEPLNAIPDDAVGSVADAHFPTVLRGYDKFAVDDYVRETSQLIAELQARSSPQAAVRRALERVGEDVSGILQRAHDTAETITAQSRSEAEDRLQRARREAVEITAEAQERVKELDTDTDRIWAERDRIVADARDLARQLLELADAAAARFPAAEETDESTDGAGRITFSTGSDSDTNGAFDGEAGDAFEGASANGATGTGDHGGEATEPFVPFDVEPEDEQTQILEPRPSSGDRGPGEAPPGSAPPSGPFDRESPPGDDRPGSTG